MTDISTTSSQPAAASAVAPASSGNNAAATATSTTSSVKKAPVVQQKMIGKYLVQVINDKCIGAASCVAIAPQVFQLNEQNIAYVVAQDGHDDDTKLLAAQSCPTAAIVVTDTSTGKQVWPRE